MQGGFECVCVFVYISHVYIYNKCTGKSGVYRGYSFTNSIYIAVNVFRYINIIKPYNKKLFAVGYIAQKKFCRGYVGNRTFKQVPNKSQQVSTS